MIKSIFISPFFVGALFAPTATASIYADLAARTVTGINDGSGVVNITNGTETRRTSNPAAKSPPGTKDLPFGSKKTAPMTEAGFKYYFEKFTSLRRVKNDYVRPVISDELKKTCMDSRDFVGCIEVLGGGSRKRESIELTELRNSMKKVSARLLSGTSLRDSSLVFQPVIDSLALASDSYPEALSVRAATKASRLFDILQSAWQGRIDTLRMVNYGGTVYGCGPTQSGIDRMHGVIGSQAVMRSGRLNDSTLARILVGGSCSESTVKFYERAMMRFVTGVLKEGAVDPAEISRYEKDRQSLYRISSMEAWERHLERNPGLKAWADANPVMTSKEQAKFNRKNPQKEITIPPYHETLEYLSKFNPPL
jgi:hypothetical protein